MKTFRISVKQRSNITYFINTTNADEFYVYEGVLTGKETKKIFAEEDLTIEGRYIINYRSR